MDGIVLNTAQQAAVDHIYGPLLVLAGPGTGKTQLLSARIAKILQVTDISPQNILCLTFTENAAQNMRDRLARIIKDDAYDVHICTYHGFGSDIIRTHSQYFEDIDLETGKDSRIEHPIDDLQRIQIINGIINRLPYSSPLIGAKHYIKHVASTISELKRGLITPILLKEISENNIHEIRRVSPAIAEHLSQVKRFPSKADSAIELFTPIMEILRGYNGIAANAATELAQALQTSHNTQKSKPLTEWKNSWLAKDAEDHFILGDLNQQQRMIELSEVYKHYQNTLLEEHLYDFDDMILKTIDVLKKNDDLRFTLQEKYQFILLDEFQDTNPAQFEVVKLLADNPVNEGMPNVFAVGDDDQAIYAFQGASVGNMAEFRRTFNNVTIINLVENYRSHKDILHIAHGIAGQIETRLHHEIDGINKTLTASAQGLPNEASIERHEFEAEANEYSWVASKITELIKCGVEAHEIAVLAPQHKYLENVVPFLAQKNVPIAYEKRENILESRIMRMLRTMTELLCACHDEDEKRMDTLFPEVLSYDFYNLPVQDIWSVNWQRKKSNDCSWAELALDNNVLAPHVLFFLGLGLRLSSEPLEYVLDYLIGACEFRLDETHDYISPFKEYFFNKEQNALLYYEMLSNLSVVRESLRSWQAESEKLLKAQDFLAFIEAYETAEQPLISTHPLSLAEDSVQLMTTYKAKGLEFMHVFLLSVHDDVWGKAARSNSNKLSLPKNLQYIRYQGSSEDELRRLLFVAVTRAKCGLYLTSHARKDNGKHTSPVKYLREYEDDGTRLSSILPVGKHIVQKTTFNEGETQKAIETLWYSRHLVFDTSLKSLLSGVLVHYKMSPTHLNTYIDLEHGGPEIFVLKNLLRFPQSPGQDGEYGNAIHYALEQYQLQINRGLKPSIQDILSVFDSNLKYRYIPDENMDNMRARGHNALKMYLTARTDMFKNEAIAEVPFFSEGVILKDARLSGKIDRLEVNKKAKTLDIVDYKTGKTHAKWEKSVKLLKYRQQLYFYKILIEGSHTWQDYTVNSARLEFIEPNSNGIIVDPLYINFDKNEEAELKKLIDCVWKKVMHLEIPDVSSYTPDYSGCLSFIKNLIG